MEISWSSTAEMVIATNGEVTRPGVGEPNAMVSLTATLSKAGATDVTKTFELTVLAQVASPEDAVLNASNALTIGYAEGDSENSVTSDVTLPTSGADGVEIRWSSTAEMVIATNGEVTRPGVGEPNAMVSLTATLSKAGATDVTKTFELTVLAQVASPEDAVLNASNALLIGYAEGDSESSVTTNVTLPTSGADGVEIRWSSTAEMVIATNGEVTRPGVGEPNAMVSLTATLSKAGATDVTKTFELTVLAQVASPEDAVLNASNALLIGYAEGDSESSVTTDVTLPTSGADGVEIRWSSTAEMVIATNGEVTRPGVGEPNAMVSLTATLSKAGATDVTKTFELTVLAQVASPEDAVLNASNALLIGYAEGDSESSVTSDVTLPTSGADGVEIRWSSTAEMVIATNGEVTRPGVGEPNTNGELDGNAEQGRCN